MRENPRSEGERWLQQAQIDLSWCRHLHQEGAHYLACFLAQQVADRYPNGLPSGIPADVYNEETGSSAVALAGEVVSEVENWFAHSGGLLATTDADAG